MKHSESDSAISSEPNTFGKDNGLDHSIFSSNCSNSHFPHAINEWNY